MVSLLKSACYVAIFLPMITLSAKEWGSWGSWSGCDSNGHTEACKGYRVRRRDCVNDNGNVVSGESCTGDQTDLLDCDISVDVHGAWSVWGAWGDCDAIMGDGLRSRERECNDPTPCLNGRPCDGVSMENQTCRVYPTCMKKYVLDKTYANEESAMQVYFGSVTYVPSALIKRKLPCDAVYNWTLFFEGVEQDRDSQDAKHIYQLNNNKLGLYQLTLNVSLLNEPWQWQYDAIYIKVSYPPPRAGIRGGSGKIVEAGDYTTDAISVSYDSVKGEGFTDDLLFDWFCIPLKFQDIYDTLKADIDPSIFFRNDTNYNLTKSSFFSVILPSMNSIINSSDSIKYLRTKPDFLDVCCKELHQRTILVDPLYFGNLTVTYNDTILCVDTILPVHVPDWNKDLIDLNNIVRDGANRQIMNDLNQQLLNLVIQLEDIVVTMEYIIVPMDHAKTDIESSLQIARSAQNTISKVIKKCFRQNLFFEMHSHCKGLKAYNLQINNIPQCLNALDEVMALDWTTIYTHIPVLLQMFEEGLKAILCQNMTIPDRGFATVPMTELDVQNKTAKLLIVKVTIFGQSSYFQQRVIGLEGAVDLMQIECRLNCLTKFATSTVLSMRAVCPTCSSEEEKNVNYQWSVLLFKETDKTIGAINYQRGLMSELNSPAFVINAATVHYHYRVKYIIEVKAIYPNNTFSLSFLQLKPDIPPYGGYCQLNPSVKNGIAGVTPFTIECMEWKDEGFRELPDFRLDWKESMTYRFLVDTELTGNASVLLYYGGERVQTVYLPEGKPWNSYVVVINVLIYDIFGDHVKRTIVTRVLPAVSQLPSHKVDIPMVSNFTSIIDSLVTDALKDGNDVLASMVIDNAGRTIGSLGVVPPVDVTMTVDWSAITGGGELEGGTDDLWSVLESADVATESYPTILESSASYMNVMGGIVEARSSFSMVTVKHLAQSVETLLNNNAFVNETSAGVGISTTKDLLTKFINASDSVQYPLYEDEVSTSTVLLGVIASSLDAFRVPMSRNLPQTSDMYANIHTISNKENLEDRQSDLTVVEKSFYASKLYEQFSSNVDGAIAAGKKYTPDIMTSIESLGSVLGNTAYRKQLPVVISRSGIETSLQKIKGEDLGNSTISRKNVFLSFPQNNSNSDQVSNIHVTVFDNPPFTWDPTSRIINSKTVAVTVTDSKGVGEQIPLKIAFENLQNAEKQVVHLSMPADSDSGSQTYYYKLFWQEYQDDLVFIGAGSTDRMKFTVYVRADIGPTIQQYDWMSVIPSEDVTPTSYLVTIPGGLYTSGKTTYIAVYVETEKAAVSRRRRSVPSNAQNTSNIIQHTVYVRSGGCIVWNEAKSAWDKNGCQVSTASTENETICECTNPPGSVFASSLFIPPNTIDFSTVFQKFDILNNGAVFGTVIALICLYVLLLVWSYRRDKQDKLKFSLGYLSDNKQRHEYLYLITVHTGLSASSGTHSNVFFSIASQRRSTGIRRLDDDFVHNFEAGSIRRFVMSVSRRLGDLDYLHVWHDNSGSGKNASWFLAKIVVEDMQTLDSTTFICNDWLSLDDDMGQIQRVLAPANTTEQKAFQNVFRENSRTAVMDKHSMLSFALRPQQDNFNRKQRLSCCVAMLFLTMIANAMFYGKETSGRRVVIGPLSFSLAGLYIALVSVVISAIPVLFISLLFQYSDTWQDKKKREKFSKLPDVARISSSSSYNRPPMLRAKKKFSLPFPFLILAWSLTCLSVLVSGFFLILYSMEWGKDVSEQWLLTFFLSFVQSAFLADPLKILIFTMVISYFMRSRKDSYSADLDINNILEKAQQRAANRGLDASVKDELEKPKVPEPPSEETLLKMKEKRQYQLKAQRAFWELVYYVFFLSVLYLITYSNRDFRSFILRQHLDDQIIKNPNPPKLGFVYPKKFNEIRKTEDFYQWMSESLLPFMFPTVDLNGRMFNASERSYTADMSNYRLGPVRLRQLRSKQVPCPSGKLHTMECYADYSLTKAVTGEFCKGWGSKPCTWKITDISKDAWSYTSSADVRGTPIYGLRGLYNGGGFIADMGVNHDIANKTVNGLNQFLWINRQTRAVFVEFTLYNAQNNLFAYVSLLTEFPGSGGILQKISISVFRTYQHHDATGLVIFICEVIVLVSMLVYTVKTFYGFYRHGANAIEDRWHIWDLIILVVYWLAFIVYFIRLGYNHQTVQDYKASKYKFVNFSHIALWDEVLSALLSVLVFLVTLRLLRVMSYNKRITLITSVLQHGAKDLAGCFVIFGIVYFAYVGLGYLLFGRNMYEYSNYLRALTTTLNGFIGKNSVDVIMSVTPVLAQLYYFSFVFMIIWIIMTMLCATLNQSTAEIRLAISTHDVPYGLQNMAAEIMSDFINIFRANSPKKSSNGS